MPLIESSGAGDQTSALVDYDAIVAELSASNVGSRTWWLSWMSCRDSLNTGVLEFLESRARGAAGAPAPPLRLIVRRLVSELKWQLKWVWLARSLPQPERFAEADVILVTMLHDTVLREGGVRHTDSYFGSLPQYFRDRGQLVVRVAQPAGEASVIAASIKAAGTACDVVVFFSAVTIADVVRAALEAICTPLKCKGEGLLSVPLVRDRIRREYAMGLPYIARGLLIERALRRLLARAPRARIVHMCENNQWERACSLAARASAPPRAVDGYMHNPIMPNNSKLRSSRLEWGLRPDPDRIITTGPAARDALQVLGTYPPGKVVAGCALRLDESTRDAVQLRVEGRVRTVLVLLSGLPSMVEVLRWLDKAAAHLNDVRVLLRGHPNRSVEELARLAQIAVGEDGRLGKSLPGSLSDALAQADAAIYVASGAVFAAAWRGLPIMHYAGGSAAGSDPFFIRPDLRIELREPEDLARAISHIDAMPALDRKQYAHELAEFSRAMMTPPDDASLAPFMAPAAS